MVVHALQRYPLEVPRHEPLRYFPLAQLVLMQSLQTLPLRYWPRAHVLHVDQALVASHLPARQVLVLPPVHPQPMHPAGFVTVLSQRSTKSNSAGVAGAQGSPFLSFGGARVAAHEFTRDCCAAMVAGNQLGAAP